MYPESLPEKRRTYLGSVTCMDTAIGEILTELDKLKLAENTLVIFTSDNGGTSKQANGPFAATRTSSSKAASVYHASCVGPDEFLLEQSTTVC